MSHLACQRESRSHLRHGTIAYAANPARGELKARQLGVFGANRVQERCRGEEVIAALISEWTARLRRAQW